MLFGQQRRKRQSRGTREKIRALFRDPLDPVVKGCLLHFSTVPSYLLLKRPAESFMHRKLKNTAEQSVDEGTQQERSEEARSAAETCNEKVNEGFEEKRRGDKGLTKTLFVGLAENGVSQKGEIEKTKRDEAGCF